jgi:hypothetical protein
MNTSQVIKHVGYNMDPYLLTDSCVTNIFSKLLLNNIMRYVVALELLQL